MVILRSVVRYQLLLYGLEPVSGVMSEECEMGLSSQLVVPDCSCQVQLLCSCYDHFLLGATASRTGIFILSELLCFFPPCHLALNFIEVCVTWTGFLFIIDLTFYLWLPCLNTSCRVYCWWHSWCKLYSSTPSLLPCENVCLVTTNCLSLHKTHQTVLKPFNLHHFDSLVFS